MISSAAPRQIAFVLTTTGNDVYARMQVLAARSVRLWVPGAWMILVLDRNSHRAIRSTLPALLELFDRILTVDVPPGSPSRVNRWMKARLRSLIDGDVLYLDGDTVVRGDLSGLWECAGNLAAVHNLNSDDPKIDLMQRGEYLRRGWQPPPHVSINGGVLFWRDTPAARRLGARYRTRWHEGSARTDGTFNDQQALNVAIADTQVVLHVFPRSYNAQLWWNVGSAIDAKIWHFFNPAKNGLPPNRWYDALRCHDPFSVDLAWLGDPHPFRPTGWLDKWVLGSLLAPNATGNRNDWRHRWLQGEWHELLRMVAGRPRARRLAKRFLGEAGIRTARVLLAKSRGRG